MKLYVFEDVPLIVLSKNDLRSLIIISSLVPFFFKCRCRSKVLGRLGVIISIPYHCSLILCATRSYKGSFQSHHICKREKNNRYFCHFLFKVTFPRTRIDDHKKLTPYIGRFKIKFICKSAE